MMPTRILAISPHADDVELGCGGTLARCTAEGHEVFVATLCGTVDTVGDGVLVAEQSKALSILGVCAERIVTLSYPVRRFQEHRQSILDDLLSLARSIKPEMVLVPAGTDTHQDHQTVYEESVRAFKHTTMLGYELPWNHTTFQAVAFVHLTQVHICTKWQALMQYRSQLDLHRPYFAQDFVQGLAKVRGVQGGSEYAEAFEAMRVHW